MCEHPDAFQSSRRKSRKTHKCCECRSEIFKGEMYQYSSGIWNGEPHSFKQCLACHEIMVACDRTKHIYDEGPAFGSLRDYIEGSFYAEWKGETALLDWAYQLSVEPEKLSKLLKIELPAKSIG